MKKLAYKTIFLLLAALMLAIPAMARGTLIPVGRAVGLELDGKGLIVAGFDESLGKAAKEAGLRLGDTIIKVNDEPIDGADSLRNALTEQEIRLTVLRGQGEQELRLQPSRTDQGPRLGIYVKDGITGIGTVTYFDPDTGTFGTLGHGVSDGSGALLPLEGGRLYPAEIISIQRGKSGKPGQLRGAFQEGEPLGQLSKNTACGVFGTARSFPGTPLPIADPGEIHRGSATILSDLTGSGPEEYAVEILQIYAGEKNPCRNLLLHVTDSRLLEATGGIVQGMSGSPILQDGKFIGAVTHVCVITMMPKFGGFWGKDRSRSPRICLYGSLFSSAPL